MLRAFQKRKSRLKWLLDKKFDGIWIGSPPVLVGDQELEPGDVLFCVPKPGRSKYARWLRSLIQAASDGVYTHCGIYLGSEQVADSVTSGVRIISLDEFEQSFRYIAVTRCPGMNPKRARAIRLYARICHRRKARYNFFGAMLVPFREYYWLRHYYDCAFREFRKPESRSKKLGGKGVFFCSELVVQCFKACGYIPREHAIYKSHIWSPTALAEENIFTLVGYRSSEGLRAVSEGDPFLGGCHDVLKLSKDFDVASRTGGPQVSPAADFRDP
jgi:hypothetical protein